MKYNHVMLILRHNHLRWSRCRACSVKYGEFIKHCSSVFGVSGHQSAAAPDRCERDLSARAGGGVGGWIFGPTCWQRDHYGRRMGVLVRPVVSVSERYNKCKSGASRNPHWESTVILKRSVCATSQRAHSVATASHNSYACPRIGHVRPHYAGDKRPGVCVSHLSACIWVFHR